MRGSRWSRRGRSGSASSTRRDMTGSRGGPCSRPATGRAPSAHRSFEVTIGNGGGDLAIDGQAARHSGSLASRSATRSPVRRDRPEPGRESHLWRDERPTCELTCSVRAGLVITGTEVLRGRVQDRNGPWLADRLAELGIELAHVMITGDRPADLRAALEFMRAEGADLVVTSGGLGPTADDLTAQVVADFAGRPLRLDEALERRSARSSPASRGAGSSTPKRSRSPTESRRWCPRARSRSTRSAPLRGWSCRPDGQVVVVLPGPPRELQESWTQAIETEPFRAVAAAAPRYRQTMMRLFGIPESEIAETLRVAEGRDRAGRPRDHDLPAPRRARDRDPGRRVDRARCRCARGPDLRAPRRLRVLDRRQLDRRAGHAPARGPAAGSGGVVHRRAAGGPADGPPRVL